MIKLTEKELDCIKHLGIDAENDKEIDRIAKKAYGILLMNTELYGAKNCPSYFGKVSGVSNDRAKKQKISARKQDTPSET